MPNHFFVHDVEPTDQPGNQEIVTPLGNVRLLAVIGDFQSQDLAPSIVRCLENGGRLYSWQTDKFDLELLLCQPSADTPGTLVGRCWAGIWRCSAKSVTSPMRFQSKWLPGCSWNDCSPDTDQFVFNWVWWNNEVTVSISTEDDDMLDVIARTSDTVPYWWAGKSEPYCEPNTVINLGQVGIGMAFPHLNAGEHCEIKFIVAWTQTGDNEVELYGPQELKVGDILAGLGYA